MGRERAGDLEPQPRRKENADETRAVAKTTIHRLLSRRDIPLRERTLWRMLYETAARAVEVLALNVEDLDLEPRRAPVRSKGGAIEWVGFRCYLGFLASSRRSEHDDLVWNVRHVGRR
ncbi:hypothetical protein ACIHFD_66865 [Nonomuraea sp. NPDC051941]|uniref:hypothetical protein n=1 Tax=Nonomuraea sp. NPDC051941 TaxID=3364373 RepID=UPI0037CCB201